MTGEYERMMTDRAWKRLHERLSCDGLLAGNGTYPPHVARMWLRLAGIAAVLTAIATLGWWTTRQPAGSATRHMHVIHNDENGSTLVSMLEDGTVVYLAGETSIRYPNRFDEDRREITLRGDAFFDINSNRAHPFIVDTEPATVEVQGTAFGIRNSSNSAFSLTVQQGEVKVTLKKTRLTAFVKAGQTVWLQAGRLLSTDDGAPAGDALMQQRIHFKDERLADVAHILNRHIRPARIEIDPELADLRLTVAFAGNDAHTMAHLICLALGLRHVQSEQTIYIQPDTDN
ncbi:MAG: FecR domain-containing protein [Tannerella sp.]|jgi:ferric-dicitrate binding protein FerR (iron transport regulator)|nr:FecR domain-containing protein [Tannerella sp.]